jgi:3D (Asp-Asp-Asp) domain-containing protein
LGLTSYYPVMLSIFRSAAAGMLCLAMSGAALAVPEKEKVGRAVVTFYWVIDETSARYKGEATAVLRDTRGRVIAHTHPRFKLDLVRQGSGWLRDGRTIIYMKRVAGESRFKISSSKYGLGSTGCRLIPYRTIAVDPHFVKHGTRIYIPQLKGAELPDGTIHDGMFIAADRGHFSGARVDIFVGAGSSGTRAFTRHGYGSRSRVTIYTAGRSRCRP